MTRKIVCDSSGDMRTMTGVDFESVPLQIVTADAIYVDDANLDVDAMIDDLKAYKGRSGTSCPNVADWMTAFGEADEVFAVTITSGLSGCYNAARCAGEDYEKQYPGRRVHVIDSLSTGPEIVLIAEKLRELFDQELSFDDIVREITAYQQRTHLLFILASVQNLSRNGRVNKVEALAVGLLNIRVIGQASSAGELEMLAKTRGTNAALRKTIELLRERGWTTGRVVISHCHSENAANSLRTQLNALVPDLVIDVHPCTALCSFYAEEGGMLIGFEEG